MKNKLKTLIILAVFLSIFSIIPVLGEDGTNISNIQYNRGIFSEGDDLSLIPVPQDISIGISDVNSGVDIKESNGEVTYLERRYLVGKINDPVDVSASFITSTPQKFESDLVNFHLYLNEKEISGDTLEGAGVIRITGDVPSDIGYDSPFSIIRFPGIPNKENKKFTAYTTSDQMAQAKNNLYLLKDNNVLKDDLRDTLTAYKEGHFNVAAIQSESALQKGDVNLEGLTLGLLIGIIIAIVLAALGYFYGLKKGIQKSTRTDLLKLEEIIVKYFQIKIENPKNSQKISESCDLFFQRAFTVNRQRVEQIKLLEAGHNSIYADFLKEKHLKPTFFQAFYESKKYGNQDLFTKALNQLSKCLQIQEAELNNLEKSPKRLIKRRD